MTIAVSPEKVALGAMMAGGNPAEGRQKDDFYPTPPEVPEALCRVESFEGGIYEPMCGDWALARILEAHGYKVVGSDINPRDPRGVKADFLKLAPRPVANIITNPPFDLAAPIIKHAMLFKPKKLALLLKSTYWHASTRLPIFEEYRPSWVYPLTWRPDFLKKGKPVIEVSWFVWENGSNPDYPRYRPLSKPSEIRKHTA